MSRLVRTLLAATGAVVLALAGGCAEEPTASTAEPDASTSASPSPGPTLPPIGAECRPEVADALKLHLVKAAGHTIAAVDMGTGPVGVVLAHQSDASLCQWMPYAEVLVDKGYRVLAFDFAGYGSSTMPRQKTYVEDLRTAVSYLRDRGTPRVVIMGASMGATMSVVAAAAIAPPVDGVIALSPPVTFDGLNAQKAAPSLKSPALFIAGDGDGDYEVYATTLDDATPADLRELLVVTSPRHGIEFMTGTSPADIQVQTAVNAFLTAHLRTSTSATPTPSR
jgi:predicted alpha/beta-hydrolase family hydrolase